MERDHVSVCADAWEHSAERGRQRSSPTHRLGDDDRTGLRVLYPDRADALHQGSISGRISPANPLALPASPPGVTGVFGRKWSP